MTSRQLSMRLLRWYEIIFFVFQHEFDCFFCYPQLISLSSEFDASISGWSLLSYINVQLECASAELLTGGSYIRLPEKINQTGACLNIKSKNQECFLHCVLAALKLDDPRITPQKRVDPSTYEPFRDLINVDGLSFPMGIREIKNFENINPDISINVYKLSKDRVSGVLYITKEEKVNHVDLLYVGKPDRFHYVLVKKDKLSALMHSQSRTKWKKYFCKTCLGFFKSSEDLLFHKDIGCGKQMVIMPPPSEAYIKFERFAAKQNHPFTFYADFEAILEPIDSCLPNQDKPFTQVKQLHTPCSYAYIINTIVEDDDFLRPLRLYRGKDCMEHFLDSMLRDIAYIEEKYLNVVRPMEILSDQRKMELNSITNCHVCMQDFKEGDETVIDHCHITTKARSKLHSGCNLLLRTPRFCPVFLHNGSNYDFSFILPEFAKRKIRLTCIPKTQEKFISFSAHIRSENPLEKRQVELRFLDSFKFLDASLATLVKTLNECPSYKKYVNERFPNSDLFNDSQKQFFCYDFASSHEILDSTVEFPSMDKFYNTLTGEHISNENYNHAKRVFHAIENPTLGKYYDLYLALDVLLLQDVMQSFRQRSFSDLGLDPVFFHTTPAFAFNACLLKIKSGRINLLTDRNQSELIRKNLRGGISSSMLRHSRANNKHMVDFDASQPVSFNVHLDSNALYGGVMCQRLPESSIEFVEEDSSEFEYVWKNITAIDLEGEISYLLLVDVEYPEYLHDLHNYFPFLPEHLIINKSKKLCPHLGPRENYLTHIKLLAQAVRHGLIIKKCKKIIKFKQSAWLADFMDFGTRKRTEATDDFQKKYYKLLLNCIFGKMIQGYFDRIVKFVTKWKAHGRGNHLEASRLVSDPNFKSFTIFSPSFAAIEMQKTKVEHNRPSIVGFSILEQSKVVMYSFYYDFLRQELQKHHANIALGYVDTDGILARIEVERGSDFDWYQFMRTHEDKFDTSDFPKDNKHGIQLKNKKVPLLFKCELNGALCIEFYAFKAKCYMYLVEKSDGSNYEHKRVAGCKKEVTKTLNIKDFYEVWIKKTTMFSLMYKIRSQKLVLETILCNKVSLSQKDDKRYILADNTHTLALNHKDIKKLEEEKEIERLENQFLMFDEPPEEDVEML